MEKENSNIISEQEFMNILGIGTPAPKVEEVPKTPEDDLLDKIGSGKEPTVEPVVEKPVEQPEPPVEEKPTETETEENVKTEQEISTQEQKSLNRFGVKDTILSLIENDIWSDVAVKIGDKEYESIEQLLTSEKANRELFDSLSHLQKQLREDKIKNDYVSIKDTDETRVKLVNAILSGVDYEDLLKYDTEVVKPVIKFDFTREDPTVTETFVRQCLIDIDGIPEKYVNAEIAELNKDFKLIEKAEEYQSIVVNEFNKEIELRKQTQDALKAKEQEELATQIKGFRKQLKSNEFSDSFIQKAVQLRFSKESDGKFHYEKLINDKLQKDENFASKFIHFLLDEEDFLKKEKSKVKLETQTKFMELVNVIPKEKGSVQTKEVSKNLSEIDEEFMTILNRK